MRALDLVKTLPIVQSSNLRTEHPLNRSLRVLNSLPNYLILISHLHLLCKILVSLDLFSFEVTLSKPSLNLKLSLMINVTSSWPAIIDKKLHSFDNDCLSFVHKPY